MLVPPSAGRRHNMQANRRKDTKPELAIRSALHGAGYRYRVDLRINLEDAYVRPDIVFTRRKIAIFVDGCFWHSCPEHGRKPTVNEDYWSPKLRRNVERDTEDTRGLENAGWFVLRIWEHEAVPEAVARVRKAVVLRP